MPVEGSGGSAQGRVILPTLCKPVHYDLVLEPDFGTFKFDGRVAIELAVLKPTSEIVLNATYLKVHSAKLTSESGKSELNQEATGIELSAADETCTLKFASELPANAKGLLTIEFTGELNDQMAGFYRSGWTDAQGVKRWMGVTQFESTDARRSFPCFDEPALKATFDISLVVDADLTAISNMNCVEEKALEEGWKLLPSGASSKGPDAKGPDSKGPDAKGPDAKGPDAKGPDAKGPEGGQATGKDAKGPEAAKGSEKGPAAAPKKKLFKFARTPVMSTYLVAYAVGPFGYVSNADPGHKRESNIDVRVYAPAGMEGQGRLGVEVTEKTLNFLEDFYGIAYPLPKCDLLAVPDFGAGAMENWGLITYRTVLLLFDPEKSSARARQNITYVIGHELAHQWFGNIVTMAWWTDLWLNEGFATFVGWLAVNHLYPSWNVWTMFTSDDLQRGLGLDSLRSSHPVEVPIKAASEIPQIFDAISYSKGASVIRQLEGWLGPDVFVKGVRSYLNKYLYANATTDDLWRELAVASGRDVAGVMGLWTRETGFPLVTVLSEKAEGGKVTVELKQERYLSTGDLTKEEDEKGVVMMIPLGLLTEKGRIEPHDQLLSTKVGSVTFDMAAEGFFKLNAHQTGFYRVKYSSPQLERLGKNISKLDSTDRVGLVADAFALSQAGYSTTVDALDLVKYYESEEDYVVLSEIASRLGQVSAAFYSELEIIEKGVKVISRKLFSRHAKKLGWEYPAEEKGDHLLALKRTLAISQASKADDEEVIKEAQRRFDLFTDEKNPDPNAIHPNLRGVVFATVLKNAADVDSGRAIFAKIMKVYKTADTADQRLAALAALGAVKQPELVEDLLGQVLDTDVVRPQDTMYPLSSLCREGADPAKTRPRAWKFVQDNWETLYTRYHSSHSLLGRMLQIAVEDITSPGIIDEVKAFVSGEGLPEEEKKKRLEEVKGIQMGVAQSLEKIKANMAWVARDGPALKAWVAKGGL